MAHDENLLSCPNVGRAAKRECTDKWGAALFLIGWVLLVVTTIAAFSKGDTDRLLYGYDFMGNVCGEGSVDGVADWSSRTKLWYPITYDTAAHSFRISSALKLGVCVTSCPRNGDVVTTYGNVTNMPTSFNVLFPSSSTLHRCLPTFSGFDCEGDAQCEATREDEDGAVSDSLGLNNFFFGIVNEFTRGWWIVLLMCILVVVLCFGWIFALRRLVKPVVFGGIILLFIVAVIVIVVSFALYKRNENNPSTAGGEASHTFLAVGIIGVLLTLVYVAVIAYLYKSINIACDIIEESSKVIVAIPSVMLAPLFNTGNILTGLLFPTSILLSLYAIGTKTLTTVNGVNGDVSVVVYKSEGWVLPAQLYVIFMALWNLSFLSAVTYLTISLVAVQWFFASPGDDKKIPSKPLIWSCKNSYKHYGTLAGGSLLVALCRFARVLLNIFEKRLKAAAGNTTAFKLVFCCANCVLSCFERIIKFLTEHAYVMTAIQGDSLITGARNAISLLASHSGTLIVNVIAELIITMGKLAITLVTTLIAFACFYSHAQEGSKHNIIGCVLVVALGAFFISSIFANVFSVCIDTVLLCYCFDMRNHNGADKPFYSPTDLQKHIEGGAGVKDKPLAQESVKENGYSTV